MLAIIVCMHEHIFVQCGDFECSLYIVAYPDREMACIINNKCCTADFGIFVRVYRLLKVDRHRCAIPMYMVSFYWYFQP